MADRVLPTGTVTFLFSDMEGSTRLVQDLGPATFREILELHNATLREAFGAHGGVERGTQGDSFLVMFPEAPAALAAAAEAQRRLASRSWPAGARVRVRMGLHTGVAALGGDDYVGVDVHRAARIAGLGHGGQVLLSGATEGLVAGALPRDTSLRSLGEHPLRDLSRAEHVYQLVIDGLPQAFPPLRSDRAARGNLPAALTTFVGRGAELEAVAALLADHRLVTLTGPGGTGKTRLALEVARSVADRYPDGAWLTSLEAVREPDLMPAAIATTFSLVESPGTTPLGRLMDFLADRAVLLVLDNFEQVTEAAPLLGDLLRGAPGLRILATSRSPLHLSMEQEVPVRPLFVPAGEERGTGDLDFEAARLFLERAGRVRPGYRPSGQDAAAIAEICRRLDGLPLGIELAAARVGLLSPTAIAERLGRRLDLPGTGRRDLPVRQQTLEAAIGWSHDLLDEEARAVLARLSVFVGGFRLEEAQSVAAPAGGDVIDPLSVLVDHNLVQPVDSPSGARYRLLETIRMFAAARLEEAGERATVRERHAATYLAMVEEAARHMPGGDQVPWLDQLAADSGNVRAAIDWALEVGSAETAHRLVAATWRFWQFRGHIVEGTQITARVLAMPGGNEPTPWRAGALDAAGGLAWWAGDRETADRYYADELRVARAIDDSARIALALFNLLHTRFQPGDDEGRTALEAMRDEARRRFVELGDERSLARLDFTAGYPLMAAGDIEGARAIAVPALARVEALRDEFYVALAAAALGGIAMAQGDVETAFRLSNRALRSQLAMGDIASLTLGLRSAATLLFVIGLRPAAARVLAAHEAFSDRYGFRPPLRVEGWLQSRFSAQDIEDDLASPELDADRRVGRAMSMEEVIADLEDSERGLLLRTADGTNRGE